MNSDRMYIFVKGSISEVDLGHSMLSVAHGVGVAFRKWRGQPDFEDWACNSFRKCLCVLTDREFEEAKASGLEYVVATECALDDAEMCLVFRPRSDWPKYFSGYKLLNEKNLGLSGSLVMGPSMVDCIAAGGCMVTVSS